MKKYNILCNYFNEVFSYLKQLIVLIEQLIH